MEEKDLLTLSRKELIDRGICPTCLNRKYNGALFGDDKDKLLYSDGEIECFFVGDPRAAGHTCIASVAHYQDMSEAPDALNQKIVRFAKRLMGILKRVFGCERVYLCTMCDGPINHYHVQLIPRYPEEERGSRNFVKPRSTYRFDPEKFNVVKAQLLAYARASGEIS